MMENGDEKRDDPAPTDAQLEQASTNGRSRDQDESLVIEREFYAEEDERRHADNPRLTSPQPGYKKYVISQYQFRRLNGWDADETEIDKEFEHFKEDVFLRWLGCFEEFPELSFKEICLNMHTRLSKKNFKGHLSDNQIDFFRLNRLRKTKKTIECQNRCRCCASGAQEMDSFCRKRRNQSFDSTFSGGP